MSKHRVAQSVRAALAMILVVGLGPVVAASASASQSGEEHRVTLCHRTNSESNPYVVVTVDKAAVVKTGHGGHDEGPVWQPGFKAQRQRWGDIIPPFTYYASPQDQRDGKESEYVGLNWTSEGQAILANGCQPVEPPPIEKEQPFGELGGECVPGDGGEPWSYEVFGTFDNGDLESVAWRLEVEGAEPIPLSSSPFREVVTAPAGSKVTLQSSDDGARTWEDEDGPVTVTDCPPGEEPSRSGSFTVVCDADGAVVTIGQLRGEGVTWALRVNGVEQPVESGAVVQVPGEATLALVSIRGSTKRVEQRATAPAACPESGTVTKTSAPASGSVVAPGATIDYTVTVTNTGSVPLTDEPVVDTLPSFVTVQGTPSDGGVVSADGRTITWTVTLAPSASKTLTYTGLVSATVPAGTTLVNAVTFLGQRATTTHTVGSRGLELAKSVDRTTAAPGDTLTYTLTVRTIGTLPQTAVAVTDTLPSGTTYVTGSAGCSGGCAGTVTVADGVVTWPLGDLAPGVTRTVAFQVTVNDVAGSAEATTIRNVGSVRSTEVGPTGSNEVTTEVPAVLGVQLGNEGPGAGESPEAGTPDTAVLGTKAGVGGLAATGPSVSTGAVALLGGLLLLLGAGLLVIPGRLAVQRGGARRRH